MRGATIRNLLIKWTTDISIHAPHAGSDTSSTDFWTFAVLFQSTLPMRGATRQVQTSGHLQFYFNPRSPCGERPGNPVWLSAAMISIHAPHAGSDTSFSKTNTFVGGFQSTLPMRGATSKTSGLCGLFAISIHAPHAGSD